MKNLFKEAHKMTREIKAQYQEVDYKLQFGLCLSYLHENKEEKEMLNKEIREELERLEIAKEEIERAENVLAKYNEVNRKFTAKMYDNRDLRRAMKNRKLWDDKDFSLTLEERYLGEGKCEVTRQKLWAKGDKVRIYFDVKVDGIFESNSHYIVLK